MQEQQRLMVEFVDYPNVLIKMFNNSILDPASHLAVFILLPDSTAKVDFIQVGGQAGSTRGWDQYSFRLLGIFG